MSLAPTAVGTPTINSKATRLARRKLAFAESLFFVSLVLGVAVSPGQALAQAGTIAPTTGPPGASVSANGGIGSNTAVPAVVAAVWDDGSPLGSVRVSVHNGPFAFSFAIPTNATAGPHTVTLTVNGNTFATFGFVVSDPPAQPPQGPVGEF